MAIISSCNSMQPKIKICGITTHADAKLAEGCGADYIGLVCDIAYSPRCISREAAQELTEDSGLPVVLLLDKPAREIIEIGRQLRPFALQVIGEHSGEELELIGRETGCRIWLPVRIPAAAAQQGGGSRQYLDIIGRSSCDAILLDTLVKGMKGGTGKTSDWALAETIAAASPKPVFLAGGINPENAAAACRRVRPAGIDVSSGVEKAPGVKDPAKVEKLIKEIRSLELR